VVETLVIALVCAGVPASLLRLWQIWWRGNCVDCGLERRVCACPPGDHTMRPRR